MGYALIWIELVVLGMLTAALLVAGAGRLPAPWARWLIGGLLIVFPFVAAIWLFNERHSITHFYDYLLSLSSCLLLGVIIVVAMGLRGSRNTGEPIARAWQPGRLALAWALVTGLHMMTMGNVDTAVRSALAATTTEAGTIALSMAPPRISDQQNAALVYLKAFEALEEPALFDEIEKTEGNFETNVAERIDAVRDALRDQQLALRLLRRAAAMPDCRFERDYARPSISMLLPEMQFMRSGALLLRYDIRIKLADRDVSGALENVTALFRMSRHMAGDSLLITHLAAVAIHQEAFHNLQAVLDRVQPNDEDFRPLQVDDTVSFRLLLGRALLMEEAFGLSMFSILPEAAPDYPPAHLLSSPVAPYVRIFFLAAEVDLYRQAMARFRDIERNPYYRGGRDLEPASAWPGTFAKLLLPPFKSVSRATVRADAEHAVAIAALAAARYRAAKGKLPRDLSQLTSEFVQTPLIDPYDGKPIRAIVRDGELVLYSIGPDGKDQQGEAFDDAKETGDLTFRLPAMMSQRN
jgi:hypothetical protein